MMKSVQVIIEGVETEEIEKLSDESFATLMTMFLTQGYNKQISETESEFYPPHRIQKIIIKTSILL